jgi:hypothetical protein
LVQAETKALAFFKLLRLVLSGPIWCTGSSSQSVVPGLASLASLVNLVYHSCLSLNFLTF